MIDYRYLRAFIFTAKHSSFSKAAQELNIAQSAVSRQIKLLEQSMGEELIIRSPQKVILTKWGQELFVTTQYFEKEITNIFANDRIKTIRVGVLQGLLESWSQRILKRYYQQHENNMTIRVTHPAKLRLLLENGRLDIAFTNEDIQSDLVESIRVFNETLMLISKEPVDTDSIHKYRWIIYNDDDNLIKIYPKKSKRIIKVNDMATVVQLARMGVGIAAVSSHILTNKSGLWTQEIHCSHESKIYLANLKFKTIPPYLKSLVDMVLSEKSYPLP